MISTLGCVLLLTPKGFPVKKLAFIFFLPLFLGGAEKVQEAVARVTVLDVGQGLSTVIETKTHVLVFDTGPKLSPQFDTGDRVVVPFFTQPRNS